MLVELWGLIEGGAEKNMNSPFRTNGIDPDTVGVTGVQMIQGLPRPPHDNEYGQHTQPELQFF